jgi:hypothetical protein
LPTATAISESKCPLCPSACSSKTLCNCVQTGGLGYDFL